VSCLATATPPTEHSDVVGSLVAPDLSPDGAVGGVSFSWPDSPAEY